jgi:hypothetical protein
VEDESIDAGPWSIAIIELEIFFVAILYARFVIGFAVVRPE